MPVDQVTVGQEIELLYGPRLAGSELLAELSGLGAGVREIASLADINGSDSALLVLDDVLLRQGSLRDWRQQMGAAQSDGLLLAETGLKGADGVDLQLPKGLAVADSLKLIQLALTRWALTRENKQLREVLDKTEQDLTLLTDIAIALSAEKNLNSLLEMILREAQLLACCDAASLFLVEKREDAEPVLIFKPTRNDSIVADFQEQEMMLDRGSIAGYVAVTDSEINIANAYDISDDAPYSFNREIDRSMGYRTVSLLSLPLRNYRGEVIGVLQFINRKTASTVQLSSEAVALTETRPFLEEQVRILRALASQSAVAIENSVLLENINNLFSGFVQASVAAIEQRDPTTSGHSFRVADLSTELAQKLGQAQIPAFSDVHFGEAELKELRYAALLHDFGKVGVREHVLTKAKKLPEGQFELIRYRIRLTQENLRRRMAEQQLLALRNNADGKQLQAVEQAARAELDRLEKYLIAIESANEPTVLEEGDFADLMEIKDYAFDAQDEQLQTLISEEEFQRLSIRRGSLSEAERAEIESHVVHTANFLRLIPWTPELARIPELAEAHHEKLDGTGYPNGMLASQIPVGSKIMAICDIFDALTASDRPYKSAVPRDIAYDILQKEGAAGKLDESLVKLFIDAEIFHVLENKDYSTALVNPTGCANHPCDPEFHNH